MRAITASGDRPERERGKEDKMAEGTRRRRPPGRESSASIGMNRSPVEIIFQRDAHGRPASRAEFEGERSDQHQTPDADEDRQRTNSAPGPRP